MFLIVFLLSIPQTLCVTEVYDFIRLSEIDKNITSTLNGQIDKSISSDTLLASLNKYRATMSKFIESIRKKDTDIVNTVHELYKNRGPSFIRIQPNKSKLLKLNGWNNTEYAHIEELQRENLELWQELNRKYILNHYWFEEFYTNTSSVGKSNSAETSKTSTILYFCFFLSFSIQVLGLI